MRCFPWAGCWSLISFRCVFSLIYGYYAARNRTAERVMMPLLDVLQSVPILSFLPVVILSLSALLPQMLAAELAAIVLIFTSQAWNMTFSFYQSMTTIPTELREAAAIFRLDPWLRFRTMELPFAALGLVWNSIMSWSGGWFFLMAAEIFNVGSRNFTCPASAPTCRLRPTPAIRAPSSPAWRRSSWSFSCWISSSGGRCWPGPTSSRSRWWGRRTPRPRGSWTC